MIFQAGVVSKWTNDSSHFLLEHFDAIKDSPSYIYHSALPFSPSSSWLQKCYSTDLSLTVKVIKGGLAEWGTCSRTTLLESYTRTLSYWNKTVAVGSKPGDIIILDVITGSQTAILSGHTEEVNCLTFSSDGTLLVSGSHDCTVKLWDVQTGGVIKTFSGHTSLVSSVSISTDCTTVASGSGDGRVYLWDIQTGECYCTIKQKKSVQCVSFSPTSPQYLISICDKKAQQWDTNGHPINPPFNASYIAFSSDGAQFVSCCGPIVTVQNSDSEVVMTKFVANCNIQCCCLSPDSKLVAVAAHSIIYVWDITNSNPHLVGTFPGHTGHITSLVFSSPSTLISASRDRSVKFWQINVLSADPIVTGPVSTPITLPLISSINLQAKDGIAISSAYGVVKTWDIPASLCKASSKPLAEYYEHGDVKLIDSKMVFVWYRDEMINIWDPERQEFHLQADVPEWGLLHLRILGGGSRIFCQNEQSIKVWDIWTGGVVAESNHFYHGVKLLGMNGSTVWLDPPMMQPLQWNLANPQRNTIFSPDPPPERLYLNDTKLWDNSQHRIQDTVTGRVVFQLPGRFNRIIETQWNGQYLAISFWSGGEVILEFHPEFLQ